MYARSVTPSFRSPTSSRWGNDDGNEMRCGRIGRWIPFLDPSFFLFSFFNPNVQSDFMQSGQRFRCKSLRGLFSIRVLPLANVSYSSSSSPRPAQSVRPLHSSRRAVRFCSFLAADLLCCSMVSTSSSSSSSKSACEGGEVVMAQLSAPGLGKQLEVRPNFSERGIGVRVGEGGGVVCVDCDV